jgi:hypothetical protein
VVNGRRRGKRLFRCQAGLIAHVLLTLTTAIRLPLYKFYAEAAYSTVTDFAKLRGWSTSVPMSTAVW